MGNIKTLKNHAGLITVLLFVLVVTFQIIRVAVSIKTSHLMGDDKYLLFFRTIAIIGIFASVLISVYLLIKKPVDGKTVAIICFILSLIFMFIITPLSPPDEDNHYSVSYLLSNRIMNWGVQQSNGNKADFDFTLFTPQYNVQSGYIWLIYKFNDAYIDSGNITVSDYMWTFKYFLEYIPQALGLAMARILHANQVWTFYSGRFINLIFYSVCVYFAIKTAPVYKTMLAIVALLPMALQQAGSYSSDAFINGISLVYVSLIIKLVKEDGLISKRDILFTILTIAILSPAKVAYSPLILLIFLISKERFISTRQYWIFIIITFASCILMLCCFSMPILIQMIESSAENTLSDNYTFHYILEHPFKTISIFRSTLFLQLDSYWNEAIGDHLSGLTMWIPNWMTFGYTCLLFLSSTRVKNQQLLKIDTKKRWFLFLSVFFTALMIMVMEFIGWTSFGSTIVLGVQGRYFIPVIPIIILFLENELIHLSKKLDKYIVTLSICLTARILMYILDSTITAL